MRRIAEDRALRLVGFAVLLFTTVTYTSGRDGSLASAAHVRTNRVEVGNATLALAVSKRIYVRDGLIRVSVRLHNGYASGIMVPFNCLSGNNPSVEVRQKTRNLVLPPLLVAPPISQDICTNPSTMVVPPGHTSTFLEYLVLRGARIRAKAMITVPGIGGAPGSTIQVFSPERQLTLRRGSPLEIKIMSAGPVRAKLVEKLPAVERAPLMYSDWYECLDSNGQTTIAGKTFYEQKPGVGPRGLTGIIFNWIPVTSRVLSPGCARPVEWHIAVGSADQPVETANYQSIPNTDLLTR